MRGYLYIFNCPVHGFEQEVFCFRACDSTLRDRWMKFEVADDPESLTDKEYHEKVDPMSKPSPTWQVFP